MENSLEDIRMKMKTVITPVSGSDRGMALGKGVGRDIHRNAMKQ